MKRGVGHAGATAIPANTANMPPRRRTSPAFLWPRRTALIILDILSRSASHGYELIKEIETLTQGNYSPSPG